MTRAAGTATVAATARRTNPEPLWEDRDVARLRLTKRYGPVGIALTAWDIWRRLPPRQRKQVLNIARIYGPKVAARVMEARARAAKRPR